MIIIGVGLDATEIGRIDEMLVRYGDRFLQRVFTDGEIAYCRAKHHAGQSFAARFAAKEAAMKALGTGHARGVVWRDVEVVRLGGPPQLRLHGAAGQHFARLGGKSAHLTLTHTRALALAHVILLGG
jgi:holo-[acyl-carrier protein] synthase